MLKRYVIALSVAASALLLPAAGAAQAAEGDTAATTVTTTTGGEGSTSTTTQTPRQIVTSNGRVVTVGTTLGGRTRDTADSSWGG
ncbi:hypothetical protein ACFWB2_22015 [Streptomyces virginiae]|uniref:hypothetical protein n=1 Tax=Streptomyces TaxID=1883 RepID=UPI0005268442|nr:MULTISPECIES: hypothetical protein [Streptomyces]MCX4718322.1 hypothetical protein [Streptomyces virginiae]MCX5275196.1 hypothetical protein [Streptomyces virginiae]MYV79964.1 hypothetical protein [Streptomyces sp. SID1046]WSC81007.1 hypothetical protein OHA56_34340 [Streptomyces virginiae]